MTGSIFDSLSYDDQDILRNLSNEQLERVVKSMFGIETPDENKEKATNKKEDTNGK